MSVVVPLNAMAEETKLRLTFIFRYKYLFSLVRSMGIAPFTVGKKPAHSFPVSELDALTSFSCLISMNRMICYYFYLGESGQNLNVYRSTSRLSIVICVVVSLQDFAIET